MLMVMNAKNDGMHVMLVGMKCGVSAGLCRVHATTQYPPFFDALLSSSTGCEISVLSASTATKVICWKESIVIFQEQL